MCTAGATPRPQLKFVPRPETAERCRVVFVCIGNSCRSQMAEGWLRHLAREQGGAMEMEGLSAGLHPRGYITLETSQVMEEKKVSLDGQQSKGLEAIDWRQADVLVNMTGLPGRSVVPGFQGRRIEWRVADPFGQPLRSYRKVRDRLERKVKKLLAELQSTSSGPAAPPVA
ncbi:MAG: hypothetical protein V3U28_11085 [Candidatus Acidoferrales bacterium]